MLPEQCFGSPLLIAALEGNPVALEMACVNEWTARDDLDVDNIQVIFVSLTASADLQLACTCSEGRKERACIHGLALIQRFREDANAWLLEELNRVQHEQTATIIKNFRNRSAFAPERF